MSEEASYINKKDDGGDAMKQMSNPALYKQLDQSAWLWTPPGAARKKFGTFVSFARAEYKTIH